MGKCVEFCRRWRFSFLLAALIIAVVIEPIAFGITTRHMWFDIVYSLALITAMASLGATRRMRVLIYTSGLLAFAAIWASYGAPGRNQLIVTYVLNIPFLALAVYVTVRGVIRSKRITWDSISGAVAGYLLLGLAWSVLFALVHTCSPGAFNFKRAAAAATEQVGGRRIQAYVYYSFVTLTTLGYGDVVPTSDATRTLAWVEAVSGQFYVAVLVAGLVGILVAKAVHR